MIRVTGDTIVEITLDAPRRNALSLPLMRELIATLRGAAGRVIVLGATGPAFCAGHDLREMVGCTAPQVEEIFAVCTELMDTVQSIPKPVIARVQGPATAAGCQLVAACDLAVATTESWFSTPGVQIGLFCSTPMVALTRAIGRKRALEMLLTGRRIPAPEAAEWGLINRAVPAGELDDAIRQLATAIVDAAPFTVSLGKRAFYEQIEMTQPDAYRFTRGVMERNALAAVAQDQMRGFLEKRGVR